MHRLLLLVMGATLLVSLPLRAAPPVVKGSDLALRWPQLIGQTVQVAVTPVQALDVVRFHVKVDGVSAVMMMMAEKVWSGRKVVCAVVTGPEKLHKNGRSQVIGLMLKDCSD